MTSLIAWGLWPHVCYFSTGRIIILPVEMRSVQAFIKILPGETCTLPGEDHPDQMGRSLLWDSFFCKSECLYGPLPVWSERSRTARAAPWLFPNWRLSSLGTGLGDLPCCFPPLPDWFGRGGEQQPLLLTTSSYWTVPHLGKRWKEALLAPSIFPLLPLLLISWWGATPQLHPACSID